YSTIAVYLLGAAVERAARKSLDAYIRDRLLREFGSSDFVVARTGLGVRQVGEVSGYDSVDAGPSMLDTSGVRAPATYGGSFVLEPCPGAGGFATSVATVARFIGSRPGVLARVQAQPPNQHTPGIIRVRTRYP